MRRLALLAWLLPGFAWAGGAAPFYHEYKSWIIACDNGLNCEAKGLNSDGTDQQATIDFTRAGGADGTAELDIISTTTLGLDDLSLDGGPLKLGAGWRSVTQDGVTTLSTDDATAIRAFVQAVRNGHEIELPGETAVPLDGLSAAMLKMDAIQGRVGTVTALLNQGAKPASEVPAPPALPLLPARKITATLAPGEAAKLIALANGKAAALQADECEADAAQAMPPEAHALSADKALVLLPCIMGAYQGSALGFIVGRGDGSVTALHLPLPLPGDSDDTDLTSPEFDPARGRLSIFAKGRGIGDCGVAASWIWDGTGFVLASLTFQDACGGATADWPVLYQTRGN